MTIITYNKTTKVAEIWNNNLSTDFTSPYNNCNICSSADGSRIATCSINDTQNLFVSFPAIDTIMQYTH